MSALTITYIIGTDNCGVGSDQIAGVEAYRTEVEERLTAEFPQAKHIDVVIESGSSKARITGLDWETEGDKEEAMLDRINQIADQVWNHGNWHNA